MDGQKGFLVTAFLFTSIFLFVSDASKILLVPWGDEFNSRMINLLKLADFLEGDGHQVAVLLTSRQSHHLKNSNITLFELQLPEEVKCTTSKDFGENFLPLIKKIHLKGLYDLVVNRDMPLCRVMWQSELPETLKQEQFDLVIVDIASYCSPILADYLETNVIQYSNYGYYFDSSIFYPNIPSIVCSQELGPLCTTERASFLTRLQRLVTLSLLKVVHRFLMTTYEDFRSGLGISYRRTLRQVREESITVAVIDFALDPSVPLMPHVIPISGLFLQKPQLLSNELDSFMQSSGKHGVIIVSFGTVYDPGHLEVFIAVLSKLPQKVIWKHKDTTKFSTSSNIKILPWIPQNDLLAHPATRLFITHCGVSSMYEAAIHGVPVVAIPLIIDQPANANKLVKRRKMGVLLEPHDINATTLHKAITEVLTNPTYAQNARATQALVNDNIMEPKEQFLYWVKYVIRHKGAKHLINQHAHEMSFIEFWSLDVYAVLMIGFLSCCSVVLLMLYFLLQISKNVSKLLSSCYFKEKQN